MKKFWNGVAKFFGAFFMLAIIAAFIFPENGEGKVDVPEWYFNTILVISIGTPFVLRKKKPKRKTQLRKYTKNYFNFGNILKKIHPDNQETVPNYILGGSLDDNLDEPENSKILKKYLIPKEPYRGKYYKQDGFILVSMAKFYADKINASETVHEFEESFNGVVSNLQQLIWINETEHTPMFWNPRQNLEKIISNMEATINDFIKRVEDKCKRLGDPDDMRKTAKEIETSAVFNEFLTQGNRENIECLRSKADSLQKQIEEREQRQKKMLEEKEKLKKVGFKPELDLSDIDAMEVVIALERNLKSLYDRFLVLALSPLKGQQEFQAFKKNCESSNIPLMAEVRLESLLDEYEPKFSEETSLYSIDHMDGHTFEHWCANLLRKNGFSNVEVTQGSNDQGVDIIAVKGGIRYAIQCKCYSSDLGNTPIQEVHTGKAIYHCQVGAVMTNRYFTAGAKTAAEATGTLLWDRDKLIEMLQK